MQTLKGFRDFLPKEALKRNWLKSKIETVFQKWGYDPLETPTLESADLFMGKIGEDERLFYKFEDQGGRKVALRYDQTVPACRVVGQYSNQLVFPFRRYQIQSAFRSENPQRGRYREFLQCDADIFGIKSPLADAEAIALSLDIYKDLGFKEPAVLINDRELLKNIPYSVLASVDKMDKIGEEVVIRELEKKGVAMKTAKEYLAYLKNLKPSESIKIILKYLKSYGFDESWYKFEPTIIRSFSYSTGPIWEVKIPEFTAGSVLGGERYDKLVKDISNVDIAGTGFAIGFDRTLEAAEQFSLMPTFGTSTKVLVTVFNPTLLDASLKTAKELRAKGINCEVYPDDSVNLDKQLKYASKKGIPFVLILGENEVKQNKVTIKNMRTGEQKTEGLDRIPNFQ